MRALILFLITALLVGCGGNIDYDECDQITAGICFTSPNPIKRDHVLRLVDITEEELLRWYPDTPDLPKFFKDNEIYVDIRTEFLSTGCVEIDDNIFACDHWIDGVNMDSQRIIIKEYPCLADTALVHELLHSYEWLHLNIYPPEDHTTPHLFDEWWNVDPDARYDEIVEVNVRNRFYIENPHCK